MGAKYTTQSASGYNSSPPPDDGSQSASNLITWLGIKAKLGDPVKTLADAINTALIAALNTSARQISVADSTVASDHMRTIEIAPTVTNTVTVSLGDAATMTTTYLVAVRNSSAVNQIISRATAGDKINGTAANITIAPGGSLLFTTNSVPDGYLAIATAGPFLDSDPIVVGSADGTKKLAFEVDGFTTATTRTVTVPNETFTMGVQNSGAQTFLGSDVSLNNTGSYFNVVNTGSIGASGQTWLIIAEACLIDTAGAARFQVRIWDGTTTFVEVSHGSALASQLTTCTIVAIVTPSAATTYTLSCQDTTSTSGTVRTSGQTGTANKATSITAIRLN